MTRQRLLVYVVVLLFLFGFPLVFNTGVALACFMGSLGDSCTVRVNGDGGACERLCDSDNEIEDEIDPPNNDSEDEEEYDENDPGNSIYDQFRSCDISTRRTRKVLPIDWVDSHIEFLANNRILVGQQTLFRVELTAHYKEILEQYCWDEVHWTDGSVDRYNYGWDEVPGRVDRQTSAVRTLTIREQPNGIFRLYIEDDANQRYVGAWTTRGEQYRVYLDVEFDIDGLNPDQRTRTNLPVSVYAWPDARPTTSTIRVESGQGTLD